jgi:hypothetical protein
MKSVAQRVLSLKPAAWQHLSMLLHLAGSARRSSDVDQVQRYHDALVAWVEAREGERPEWSLPTLDAVLGLTDEWPAFQDRAGADMGMSVDEYEPEAIVGGRL